MSGKKLYLHYEGYPEYTYIFKGTEDDKRTVEHLRSQFVKAYNAKHASSQLLDSQLQVQTESGASVDMAVEIRKAFHYGGDVYMVPVTTSENRQNSRCTEYEGSQGRQSADGQSSSDPALDSVLSPLLAKAKDAETKKYFRVAYDLYEHILGVAPKHREALVRVTHLLLLVNRRNDALKFATKAVDLYPTSASMRHLLGLCQGACGRQAEALQEFEKSLLLAKEYPEDSMQEWVVQISMVRALLNMGEAFQNAAAALVMHVLEQDDSNREALFEYARIALARGMVQDAIRVLLRLLVQQPDNTGVREQIAKCLEGEEGLAILQCELGEGSDKHAALAFLATVVKDHGAVKASIALYRNAVQLCPLSASYGLNLMHTLELEQDYQSAVDVARHFCRASDVCLGGGLDISQVADQLEGLPHLSSSSAPLAWLLLDPWEPQGSSRTENNGGEQQNSGRLIEYSVQEMDALALLFTACKVLYVGGALTRAALVVNLVEKARAQSRKALHTTLIRNEAAYFGCITQLTTCHAPPPIPQAHSVRPLYLCGDSHCLSGSWRTVTLRGETRLLVPQLVTGCKVWHLRNAGCFYPKIAFLNTVNSIPSGSQVVFLFGEIDCREGLPMAVDKLKYDTLDGAIRVLVDIYIDAITELINSRKFEIFVHPVPPVLDVTRHLVMQFNRALKTSVIQHASSAELAGRLHWLDFAADLLSADGSKLDPELEFDGTHLAPVYVKHLSHKLANIE